MPSSLFFLASVPACAAASLYNDFSHSKAAHSLPTYATGTLLIKTLSRDALLPSSQAQMYYFKQ